MKISRSMLGVVCALVVLSPLVVWGETYVPLTEFVGFSEAASASSEGDFSVLINILYRMAIGIGSAVAVVLLVVEGLRYATTSAVGKKTELRQRLTMIIGGLFVLVGAYSFLALVDPNLTIIDVDDWERYDYSGVVITKPVEPKIEDHVTYEDGMSDEEVLNSIENPTVEEYRKMFGRTPPASRVTTDEDGTERVRLSSQERMEIIKKAMGSDGSIGVTSQSGETYKHDNSTIDEEPINVTKYARQAVAAAITLCPNIPRDWVGEEGLYKIIAKESNGIVARPNYALEGYMKQEGISRAQITSDIRNNSFYFQHCCRVTTQSSREAQENGLSGIRCNRDTQSGLMDYTRAQANAGKTGYSHINGKCTSAAGIGQLLNYNMHEHQPSGVRGFGDPSEELCGMMNYIKQRYGDPGQAWARYKSGIGY